MPIRRDDECAEAPADDAIQPIRLIAGFEERHAAREREPLNALGDRFDQLGFELREQRNEARELARAAKVRASARLRPRVELRGGCHNVQPTLPSGWERKIRLRLKNGATGHMANWPSDQKVGPE